MEIWARLDIYGRDVDTMAGNPLPLRLHEVDAECARTEDPDAQRRMVLLIEEIIYQRRLERKQEEIKSKK